MINWRVRIKNKNFWLCIIPAVLLLIQTVATPFGYSWDFAGLSKELTAIVNAAFAVLSIIGVVTDPTTAGVGDSAEAMTYEEPRKVADGEDADER